MRVSWFTLESLTARASADGSIGKVVARITGADLIVVDDVGVLLSGASRRRGLLPPRAPRPRHHHRGHLTTARRGHRRTRGGPTPGRSTDRGQGGELSAHSEITCPPTRTSRCLLTRGVSERTFTRMTTRSSILSTAESRRPVVTAAALTEFARAGFHGTTIADVAREAKISPAYVCKLFPGKGSLFAAALEACFDEIIQTLERGADAADQTPAAILQAMGGAYAELIGDRRLLMLQVHAQSVADVPEIGDVLRAGYERITTFAQARSGGSDDQVQQFVAHGQLCHLLVTARIDGLSGRWAEILSNGIRHPG